MVKTVLDKWAGFEDVGLRRMFHYDSYNNVHKIENLYVISLDWNSYLVISP